MKHIITITLIVCALFYACTKDIGSLPKVELTDELLFTMVKNTTGQYCYKAANNDTTFVSTNTFGGHPGETYSLRVNKKAFDAMTASGKLPDNGIFPDSSLLVKKLYTSFPNQVDQYAVIFKDNGAWKWAKYTSTGDVIQSFKSADASNCQDCHPTGTKDHVNTFGEHP